MKDKSPRTKKMLICSTALALGLSLLRSQAEMPICTGLSVVSTDRAITGLNIPHASVDENEEAIVMQADEAANLLEVTANEATIGTEAQYAEEAAQYAEQGQYEVFAATTDCSPLLAPCTNQFVQAVGEMAMEEMAMEEMAMEEMAMADVGQFQVVTTTTDCSPLLAPCTNQFVQAVGEMAMEEMAMEEAIAEQQQVAEEAITVGS